MAASTDLPRVYFTVTDDTGRTAPAVEYWAEHFDEAVEETKVLPLCRFVKLIGSGECLKAAGNGTFVGVSCGRTFHQHKH